MPSSWLCPSDHVQSAVLALWPACHAGIGLLSRAAVHYMAADPQLGTRDRSSSLAAAADFRQMVAQLHEQGIEVLLQVSCAAPTTSISARGVLFMRRAPVMPSAGGVSIGGAASGCPLWPRAPTPLLHSPSVNAPCPHSQVDLTFTAEGTDAHPSSLSLRGLDYGAYYRSNGVSN